jgi:hypothetical protein
MRHANASIIVAALGLSGSLALAQVPQAPSSTRPTDNRTAAPTTGHDDLEPAVNTSATPPEEAKRSTASPTPAPAASASTAPPTRTPTSTSSKPETAAARAAAPAKSGKAQDRIELDTTQITGNRELPKVLYIVPWKRSDLGDLTGKPVNSLLDEVLQPVDRDVFKRENRYYRALAPGESAAATPGPDAGGTVPSR